MGEAEPHEVDIVLVQLLSSSYNESKYRHDETMRMLSEIHGLIESQTERIIALEKEVTIMKPVVAIITLITTIVGAWAIPRILESILS